MPTPATITTVLSSPLTAKTSRTTLKTIRIEHGVTTISQYAFDYYDTTNNIHGYPNVESITLPNTIVILGSNAFYVMGKVTSIIIPESVLSIGIHAIESFSSLTTVIFKGIREPNPCDSNAFSRSTQITSIIVPTNYENNGFCGKSVQKQNL